MLGSDGVVCVSLCAYCLFSGHWAQQSGSVAFILSQQAFMHTDQTLLGLLSSRLYNRCSYPLIFFVAVAALAHSTHHQLLRGEIL